ncbi:MAG TPA: class I SAM-dependent methyltransferase [Stellaceae bacterium]|jgi:SAM-dependent methyltransferase|nr:class I SAM-dependent methyltransferase [Stellaceae bacterium]
MAATPPKSIPVKTRELAQWNERFDREDYWFGTEPTPFLADQAHRLQPGMAALSIADGEGRNGVWLARQGLKVTTVDLSPKAIAKAQRLAARFGVAVETINADLEAWDWGPPRFDLVVGILFQFAGPAWRDGIFRAMKDVLKPGGLIMIQGYRPEQIAYGTGGPPFVENLYTADLLRAAFAELEILHLAEYDREQPEGMQQRGGMCALIDLVARKV